MASNSEYKGLPVPKDASELMELYFLEIRSHLLEAAAGLDRVERANGGKKAMEDPRIKKLKKACTLLMDNGACRAERFLELFSEN